MNFMDILDGLGYIADTPGAYTRGALAGKPFERASGDELLEAYGMEKGPMRSALGFGAEMLIDPLNLIPGAGAGAAATKVGLGAKALSALGVMPEAAKATLFTAPWMGRALGGTERIARRFDPIDLLKADETRMSRLVGDTVMGNMIREDGLDPGRVAGLLDPARAPILAARRLPQDDAGNAMFDAIMRAKSSLRKDPGGFEDTMSVAADMAGDSDEFLQKAIMFEGQVPRMRAETLADAMSLNDRRDVAEYLANSNMRNAPSLDALLVGYGSNAAGNIDKVPRAQALRDWRSETHFDVDLASAIADPLVEELVEQRNMAIAMLPRGASDDAVRAAISERLRQIGIDSSDQVWQRLSPGFHIPHPMPAVPRNPPPGSAGYIL